MANIFIISAPSGCGKTSLVKALLESMSDLCASISHTTHYEVNIVDVIKTYACDDIIIRLDELENNSILGYACFVYYSNFTFIVMDRLVDDNMFKAIVMHELGHLLGIFHIHKKYTLMYPYSDGIINRITKADLRALCKMRNYDEGYFI